MNRRQLLMLPGAAFLARRASAQERQGRQGGGPSPAELDKVLPDQLLLKDYRPRSIYKIPVTEVPKAKYPVIDMHYHARVKAPEDVDNEVRLMDEANVERTIVFCNTGERFDAFYKLYSKYPKRFDPWCGLDMSGSDQPGFGAATIKELERCRKVGAVGVGEIIDKGRGIGGGGGSRGGTGRDGQPRPAVPAISGPHADDPRMDAIWERCADLGMPINLHVSDPYWSYLAQDRYNDGLMNGYSWRIEVRPGIMGHDDLILSIENACKKHPRAVFIAAHLVNLDYDLMRLGQLFDRHPNLYADISARFCETAPIPRFASQFFKKYGHRVVYGTDIPYTTKGMFATTFRVMETNDEHFYAQDVYFNFNYHWPMHGFGLPDDVLKKMYRNSALSAISQARKSSRT
jgi:hypothetical protein